MAIVSASDTFPDVRIVHTHLTVTITAAFEITERGQADEVARAVSEAVGSLAGDGEVSVVYETEEVEG